MFRTFGESPNVLDMELYRVNQNNFGDDDDNYYVVANSVEEAVEIIELATNRKKHFTDRAHDMNGCYVDGLAKSPEALIGNNGTGYYRIKTDPVSYNMNAVMPFIPLNVRQHYIDIALKGLE